MNERKENNLHDPDAFRMNGGGDCFRIIEATNSN